MKRLAYQFSSGFPETTRCRWPAENVPVFLLFLFTAYRADAIRTTARGHREAHARRAGEKGGEANARMIPKRETGASRLSKAKTATCRKGTPPTSHAPGSGVTIRMAPMANSQIEFGVPNGI